MKDGRPFAGRLGAFAVSCGNGGNASDSSDAAAASGSESSLGSSGDSSGSSNGTSTSSGAGDGPGASGGDAGGPRDGAGHTEPSPQRVTTTNGRTLEISAPHPTAAGRTFGDLRVGARLDGHLLESVEVIGYTHAFTYDILPDSQTGTDFAAGMLIGSTLR